MRSRSAGSNLFFTDHTHIPATPQTRKLMEETQGGVQPHFTHNYDPFIAIAYAAATTQTTLRLGTGVCLIPEREPIATAKTVASLDVLSHGSVLFGVGVGWIPEEIADHGIDPPTRWAVMDERVQAMRAIWTQDEAEHHGHHVDFEAIRSWPKPKHSGHFVRLQTANAGKSKNPRGYMGSQSGARDSDPRPSRRRRPESDAEGHRITRDVVLEWIERGFPLDSIFWRTQLG